jgi:hypothetical protein
MAKRSIILEVIGPNRTYPTQRNRAEFKRERLWGSGECCPGCLGQNYYANSKSQNLLTLPSFRSCHYSMPLPQATMRFSPPLRFPVRPRAQLLLAGPTPPPYVRPRAYRRTDTSSGPIRRLRFTLWRKR